MFKNALVSVFDKNGLVELLKPLQQEWGTRIVSTGQTAQLLKENGLSVIEVCEQTGFAEVMGGRVKTLHPYIHMCLLARENDKGDEQLLSQKNLQIFDLVIGNLYPFRSALEKKISLSEQMEFVDIGGPAFLRAAAKNFSQVTVVCDPKDYKLLRRNKKMSLEEKKGLAAKTFRHVSQYDEMISSYLCKSSSTQDLNSETIQISGQKLSELRYGENPHQKSSWFCWDGQRNGIHKAYIAQGKSLSHNNLLDIDAAVVTLREFQDDICCVSVKHSNPCGVALGSSVEEAVKLSLRADPKSVFGGILALNGSVNKEVAEIVTSIFLECVVAPHFSEEALQVLSKKKRLRVLVWPDLADNGDSRLNLRSVDGGFLLQEADQVLMNWDNFEFIGEKPKDEERKDIELAWKVCAHLKSNAIAISLNGQTIGLGMGQVNRVDAVKQAISRAKEFHSVLGSVLASDGFFPFEDSLDAIVQAKIKWVIQPGGSINDEKIKTQAKALGLNMILTGQRHFFH